VALSPTFTFFPPPNNDACASATVVAEPRPLAISTIAALAPTDNSPIACTASAAMNNDVWYRWTATSDGSIALVARGYPNAFAGRYAIYDGGVSPGACPTGGVGLLACNAFAATTVTSVLPNAPVIAGHVYYFQLASQTAGTTGTALLDFEFSPTSVGGCCLPSGCAAQTSGECSAAGGTYLGDGVMCSTATGTVSSYTGGGGSIPDYSATGPTEGFFSSQISVADTFAIADVEVDIVMAHSYQGDLVMTLDNGSRTAYLNNRGRRGETTTGSLTADFITANAYTWSDSGAQSIWNTTGPGTITTLPSGVYRPAGVHGLSRGFARTFNGLPAAGTWTLTIRDHAGSDVGTVASWTLRIKQGGASPCSAPAGVCCRGATCTTSITSQAACAGSLAGALAGASFASSAACNTGPNTASPCCYPDYNKLDGVSVQDIFDFLNDWLAGKKFALVGGSGDSGDLNVQNIFDFLNAWFAGGCTP
jgi:subtilisin-like proprotein convertase family protein